MINKKGLRFSGIGMIDFYYALRGAAKIRGNEEYHFSSELSIIRRDITFEGKNKRVVVELLESFKSVAYQDIRAIYGDV
jgi:hypothetical protein